MRPEAMWKMFKGVRGEEIKLWVDQRPRPWTKEKAAELREYKKAEKKTVWNPARRKLRHP